MPRSASEVPPPRMTTPDASAADADLESLPLAEPETIRLDQFLKLWGVVGTGGQAKQVIQAGAVTVNGETETRRRKKLVHGDAVEFAGDVAVVEVYEEDGSGDDEAN